MPGNDPVAASDVVMDDDIVVFGILSSVVLVGAVVDGGEVVVGIVVVGSDVVVDRVVVGVVVVVGGNGNAIINHITATLK